MNIFTAKKHDGLYQNHRVSLVRVTGLEGAKNRIVMRFQRLLIPKTLIAIRQIIINSICKQSRFYTHFIPKAKSQSLF